MQVTVSIPQSLYRRVRLLADTQNKPVDDVLAQVLDEVLPMNDETTPESDESVERERLAYIEMHPMLKESYMGQHVAIFGGQLIDVDTDFDALYARIDEQYPEQFVWLATVEEEPMPVLAFRSPRLEPIE